MLSPAQLAKIHEACFTTPRPWSEAEMAGLLSMPGTFLVCSDSPAFALGRVAAGEVELLTIAVSPAAQRQGLGRKLLKDFETEAMAQNAQSAFLEVAETNAAARHLYMSHGYSESGKRPRYYAAPNGQKIDAIVMMKALKKA